jgi:hypothetical protein
MSTQTPIDIEDLLEKLSTEISDWEFSDYYLEDEELFDIERFLLDHNAHELKAELEAGYGQPLNRNFWSASLTYQRLKRAREEVKALDAQQERKRQDFVQAVEEDRKARQELLNEIMREQRRARLRLLHGGKKDSR